MRYANREAASLSGEVVSFSFGLNWQKHLSNLDQTRIASACRSIQEFAGLEDLGGYRFSDAGCGSGLFLIGSMASECKSGRLHGH